MALFKWHYLNTYLLKTYLLKTYLLKTYLLKTYLLKTYLLKIRVLTHLLCLKLLTNGNDLIAALHLYLRLT